MNTYEHYTDSDLVALLVKGNAKAFEAIYMKYSPELYAYARRNVPTEEDCEEIVQDVFEEIWQQHHKLTFVTVLKGYLYRLLRFRIVRYFRHENVRRRYEEHYKLFEAMYDTFSEGAIDEGINEKIEEGLAALPERCQEAVKLRLKENLSNDDIAVRMNIKKSTVENYMAAAVKHLRATFPKLYNAG